MTDEQINAAITEAIDADPHWKCAKDYCSDLNAMHEAENTILDTDLFYDYCLHLGPLLRANARQRAEAFLRTLGKWDHIGDTTEMVKEAQK